MNTSKVEEMLGGLHWIAAILCFAYGYHIAAWAFVARAIVDEAGALTFAIKNIQREKS